MEMHFAGLLRRVIAGDDLTAAQAAETIGAMMDGEFTPVQSAGLLAALAAKGERLEEIVGAARAMRERSLPVEHGLARTLDIVGTGGDGAGTMNISTMAALLVAAAGVPVAKHGNRAASSACGSADVLEAAGLPIDLAPERSAAMLRACNFTFMFAPRYHPAMKNVAPVRRELGVRTMFNILGPLANPARATHQMVGVARPELLDLVAGVLGELGVRGVVVHGAGGIDEVAGEGESTLVWFSDGNTRCERLDPAELGVRATLASLTGASVEACREAFFAILGGERSPRADVVALNAAVAMMAAGEAGDLGSFFERMRELLASGAALRTFERAREFAHG